MEFPSDNLERAYKQSSNHRAAILASARVACFYCRRFFPPSAIEEWIDSGQTAVCPHCSVDSVLADHAEYPLTPEFLDAMHARWFGFTERSTP